MDDYTPNSNRFKEQQKENATLPEKKIQQITTGKVRVKKKSEMSKFKDVFISEDVSNVKSYIFMDVLVPAVKKAISDIVRDGIDMILYGDTKRGNRSSNASYVSYRDYSRDRRDDCRSGSRNRSGYSYDDIILETRGEAEDVLTRMDELIETYGVVSVADMYDLVGKTCNYTDNKYGWKNIRTAEPIRVRDGYMLKLPKAGPID
ncbi:hypothetical protein [Blautia glucerasea]|uniref:hypothetical protein n=1 Tax=Blautia glucerasea TaxID=536633 RepID=UPI00156D740F|nr:hypothetical protein [Blautia glucerasea]NSJ25482.1 hypothetical protein [Blautia glucerasea]